jgi:hypothetical protein
VPRDTSLDNLLGLHGDTYVVTAAGHWVKFDVAVVPVTVNKPHGLHYSLTLHNPQNKRILGYDNAHPVKPATWRNPFDHRHVFKRVMPYEYRDAAALLEAFWADVDRTLKRLGVDT